VGVQQQHAGASHDDETAPPPPPSAPSLPPHLSVELGFLVLLAVLWGASHTLIEVALETIPPFTIVAARVSVAAVLLVVVARRRHLGFPGSRTVWGMLVVQALLLNAAPFTLITWGQQFIDSGLAGVLNATPPLFTFLITLIFTRHEPATPQKLIGVLCGLGGVTVIVGTEALHGLGIETLGQLAIVGASLCYGVAAVNGRRLASLSPIVSAAGTMVCSAMLMLPLSVLAERPWTVSPSPISLAALGALAVFSTAGATIVYFRLLSTLGSIGTSSNSYLRAAVSVLLGMVLLGERPGWMMLAGLVLIVLAITAINGQFRSLRPWVDVRFSQS
jgi:drug/metabolite transporter (DMT)-like permease